MKPTTTAVRISLVCPVHNEAANLRALFEAIEREFADENYELVLVDDGSRDESWALIAKEAAVNPRVRGVRFGRNFGHQAAITAGIRAAVGQAVITMDADLQDPPVVARQLIARWAEGFDIVEARRLDRAGETWFKLATAHLYYRLLRATAVQPMPVDVGDFRLLSRRAVEALADCPERDRYLRGLVAWLGLPRAEVLYHRTPRHAGATSFSIGKMVRLATTGVLAFTDLPQRAVTTLGVGCLFTGLGVALAGLIGAADTTLLLGGMLAQVGVTFLTATVCLTYITRLALEARGRPLYVIAEQTTPRPSQSIPDRVDPVAHDDSPLYGSLAFRLRL